MSTYSVGIRSKTDPIVGDSHTVTVYELQTTIGGERFVPIHHHTYKTLKGAQANRDMLCKAYNCEGVTND